MSPRHDQTTSGNTLLVVVVFVAVLGVSVVSYLMMVNNSNYLTARALTWNTALPVAEAGIEEAAAAIQTCSRQPLLSVLQTNGWAASGQSLGKTRVLTNAYYNVLITSTNPAAPIAAVNPPVIYSTGYVRAPLRQQYIGRVIKVSTKYNRPWLYALLAKDTISIVGSGTVIDSYNSKDPAHSTNERYDSSKRDDHAHLGCASWLPNCISAGPSLVYGDANTAFGGTTAVGPSGCLGDAAFVGNFANMGFVQAGRALNNLSATFLDNQAPFASGASLYSAVVNGTTYAYVADATNYYFNGTLNMPAGSAMLVRGKATIYVTGSFTMGFGSYIRIASGARLRLVVGGSECRLSGWGIVNETGQAVACSIEGLPACTVGEYSGGSPFIGTINAPQADWRLSGPASFCGAAEAKSFALSGGLSVHYDEGLAQTKNGSLYTVDSWREL